MRRPSVLAALLVLPTALMAGCWSNVDKGQPGVYTRVTPQAHGAEWVKLKTELDGKSPVPAGAAHGEAPGSEAAAAHH